VVALIDDHIQSESLRPEWIAAESGMSVLSLYRMFAEKLVVAQYIKPSSGSLRAGTAINR
jgi:AraC family transcriptional activator of tynA and feaB